MSRKIGIMLWFIAFAVSLNLMIFIPRQYTSAIYAEVIFTIIAFVSTLILWVSIFRTNKTVSNLFYCSSAMTISTLYLLIQVVIGLIISILAERVTIKVVLIVNIILTALVWIVILATIGTKDYIKRVDSRQKDHHVEL